MMTTKTQYEEKEEGRGGEERIGEGEDTPALIRPNKTFLLSDPGVGPRG